MGGLEIAGQAYARRTRMDDLRAWREGRMAGPRGHGWYPARDCRRF
jgi:hypothetical protein